MFLHVLLVCLSVFCQCSFSSQHGKTLLTPSSFSATRTLVSCHIGHTVSTKLFVVCSVYGVVPHLASSNVNFGVGTHIFLLCILSVIAVDV